MPDRNLKKSLFELGQIVATPGSIEALQQAVISAASLLCSHQCGDWGDLENKDLAENKRALNQGFRIFSSYHITCQSALKTFHLSASKSFHTV
jgi:hypothetical protein